METKTDWKVLGLLFAPTIISLFGFAWVHDAVVDLQTAVKERPTIIAPTSTQCIKSENRFGWWHGTQEIGCNG